MTNPAELIRRNPADLVPYARNAKKHSPEQIAAIAGSIREFGFNAPVLIDAEGGIIAGHGRVQAALKLQLAEVPCIVLDHLTETQRRAYILADNKLGEIGGGWDADMLRLEIADLADEVDLTLAGFDLEEMGDIMLEDGDAPGGDSQQAAKLADKFGIPPFTVLNAREGWWQERKRAWLAMGIKSELGRGEQLIPNGGGLASKNKYDR